MTGLITQYLGSGLLADRPATPDVATGTIGLYFAEDDGDAGTTYLYNPDTAAWQSTHEGYYSATEVDAAIAAAAGGDSSAASGVVTGLGVAYSGAGLTFNMAAGTAKINGDLITAAAQSVILAAADATHPRIDVFYVDDTGTFGKITGTAAANPSQPTVDPTSQLYLGFALVPATAADLTSGITTETIYDEGVEWTATTSGSGFTVDSTNNPNTGTKCIEGTAVAAAAYVKFVDGSPTAFDSSGNLILSIRSKAVWNSKRSLLIQWYASGVAKGSPVTIKGEGTYGFTSANITTYQTLIIPKTAFAVPAGTTADELRISAAGAGGTHGFYLDTIKSQTVASGSGGGGTTTGITQDQADARYLKLTGGTLTGDLIVPGEAYGVGWNGSNETPTKNDIYDKIEAVVGGLPGSFTTEDAQDAVGAMVDATLIYTDATPVLKRAPITGHVTIADGSNAAALGSFTKAQLDAAVSDGNVLYVGDAYAPGGTDVALADGGTGASLADPGADRVLFWDDSAGAVTWLTMGTNLTITGTTLDASGGGSGAGWSIVFRPRDNEPPTTNYATLDTRNGHPCLDFDPTTQETAIFSGVLPADYAGGGITVYVHWAASTALGNTIGWDVSIERVGTALDIDADSFATAQTITAATVSGTAGILSITSVAIANGADMDSLAAGESFRIRIRRDVANDTATGDAELFKVVIKET